MIDPSQDRDARESAPVLLTSARCVTPDQGADADGRDAI